MQLKRRGKNGFVNKDGSPAPNDPFNPRTLEEFLNWFDETSTGSSLADTVNADRYPGWKHTQEYRNQLDESAAEARIHAIEILRLCPTLLNVPDKLGDPVAEYKAIYDWAVRARASDKGKRLADGANYTPTEPDWLILEALAKLRTRCKTEALFVGGVGQRVKGDRLRALEDAGLVDRTAGKKKGWAITSSGRTILAKNAQSKRT